MKKTTSFTFGLPILLCITMMACQSDSGQDNAMRKNRQTVELYYKATNEGDTAALRDLVSQNYMRLAGGIDDLEGIEDLQRYNHSLKKDNKAFTFDIQQLVVGANEVAILWEANAISMQDKPAKWLGCNFIALDKNGKILSERLVSDRLVLMQQLGYDLVKREQSQEATAD